MVSEGIVRAWSDEHGTGEIESADTPGGCWVHFTHVVPGDATALVPGDRVTFTHEAVSQDGFSYRAILVWPPGVEPGTPQRDYHQDGPSAGYQSTLTIRWQDGTVTEGLPDR